MAEHESLKLDLGCGNVKRIGYIGVDIRETMAVDVVADLSNRWPWNDSVVDEIRAFDFIEHVADKLHTLREMWRVLKDGGTAVIQVPDATVGQHAFRDPTHVSFWVPKSFSPMYMEPGEYHPGGYHFIVEELKISPMVDEGRWIIVHLRAVKEE